MEPKQQVNRIAKNMIEYVGYCDIRLDRRDDALHDGRRPDPLRCREHALAGVQ